MKVGVWLIRAMVGAATVASPTSLFAGSLETHECRYRASFNCAAADDAISRIICTNPSLMAADCAMGYAYRDARNSHERLRKDQRQWARVRDAVCAKRSGPALTACLTAETEKRLRWLVEHYKLPVAGKIYERYSASPARSGQ